MTAEAAVQHAVDLQWMDEALALAARGAYTTQPNPRVGCVLVRDGAVVGRGFHARAGQPHAEVMALADAGELARGATAYVTLEPCSHHGRTPPCAPQLAAAGVARVVSSMTDPDPRVAGRGHALLAAAGVAVSTGVRSAEARALNAGFLSRVERGRPWVTVKIAQSLDGRTALANGESRWITGEAARRDVQFLRARHAAVLTGIDTVLRDDARLNVRLSADELGIEAPVRQPVRVVLDSGLRLSPFAPLFDVPGSVWLYSQVVNGSERAAELAARGVELLAAPHHAGKGLDLGYILEDLAHRGINEVLVEAGAKLSGAFLSAGWVDELIIYQAPVLLGPDAQPSAALPALSALDHAMRWRWVDSTRIGADIRHVLRPAFSVEIV